MTGACYELQDQSGRESGAACSELRTTLAAIYVQHRSLADGRVADHIPELAKADLGWFRIVGGMTDGEVFEYGDAMQPFSIQSIAKTY